MYTGGIILAFIILHLANFHFTDTILSIADMVTQILHNPVYFLLYCIGISALGLHISHGFWSLFQSLGLNHPLYNRLIKTSGLVMSCLLFLVFLTIIVLLLFNNRILTVTH
jgi:succinate dehydrogenase / fumarate reductase cytochrome b subunit